MRYNNIEWVWLDLDDTLWDFRANSIVVLSDIYDAWHMDRWFDAVEQWITSYQTYNHHLWNKYNRAEITKQFLQIERFRYPLVAAGCDAGEAMKMSIALDKEYLSRLGQMGTLVDGARDLIARLHQSGYKIGILSNGFKEVQYAKLHSAHIDSEIDMVVLSDDIGINKPDRRLFDYAVDRACTSSSKCVMVGDNLSTDIIGAVGAGWHAIYFDPDCNDTPGAPDGIVIVQSLTDVAKLLCF